MSKRMKRIKWLWVAMVLFTAVSLACQLSSVDLLPIEPDKPPQPHLPEFAPPEKGFNRGNPFAVGEPIELENWVVEVLQFARGQEAWDQLKTLPYNNEAPAVGEEYVLVQMHITHTNESAEEESVGIALTGSAGLKHHSFNSSVTPPAPYLVSTMAGGESQEGWYAFVIVEGETDLMLVVEDHSLLDEPLMYGALEEGASLLVPTDLTAVQPTNRGQDIREPVPFGSTVTNEDWELTVTDVVVGEEAWEMLLDANQFNDPPGRGVEYVLAKIKIRYLGQGDQPTNMYSYYLRLLNHDRDAYDTPALVEPIPRFDFVMYPGAEAEGWLALAARQGDTGLMLRFNPTYQDDSPEIRYLSLDAGGR